MKKRIISLILSLCLILSFSFTVGCNKEDETDRTFTPENQAQMVLNYSKLDMLLGESIYLIASGYQPDAESVLTFSSSNNGVAAVNNAGLVQAEQSGTAVITASYGEQTAKCEVTVSMKDVVPSILTAYNINDDQITIDKSGSISLSPSISFNSKTYSDGTFEYEYDSDVIDIDENGKITAKQVGSTTVRILGTWRGISDIPTMVKEFTVKVINTVTFVVNGGEFTEYSIYSITDGNKSNEMDFSVKGFFNGETEVDVKITGDELVKYEDGKITSNGKWGVGNITLTAEYQGEKFNSVVAIDVLPVVYKYVNPNEYFEYSAMDGELPLDEIFGKDTVLARADYEGKRLTVDGNNNVIKEVIDVNGKVAPKVKTITVYNDSIGYEVDAKLYTKIIDEPKDFAVFDYGYSVNDWTAVIPTEQFTGYYILSKDIDMRNYKYVTPFNVRNIYKSGLTGTFDGNGYTISNLTFGGVYIDGTTDYNPLYGLCGLFGEIYGGTVKNVAFRNVVLDSGALVGGNSCWTSLLASVITGGATIENVYAQIELSKVGVSSTGLSLMLRDTVIKNSIFEVSCIETARFLRGSLSGEVFQCNTSDWENVYVVSKNEIVRSVSASYELEFTYDAVNCGGTIANVKRYATKDAMRSDSSNNYSDFSTEFWKIYEGVPVWHDEKIIEQSGKTANYSQLDKGLDVSLNSIVDGATEVESATTGYYCSYNAGELVIYKGGDANFKAAGEVITLIAKKADVWYSFDVKLYTKVINEASDLTIFSTNVPTSGLDGYYALTQNIDASNYTHAAVTATSELKGVLDGNGYTIDGITLTQGAAQGMAGLIYKLANGSVVKNLGITGVKFTGSSGNGATLAYSAEGANISNVYVETTVPNAAGGVWRGGFICYFTGVYRVTMTNCLIKVADTSVNGLNFHGGSLSGTDNTDTAFCPNTTSWSNVFVVSNEVLNKSSVNGAWVTNYDAINQKPEKPEGDTKYLANVYRYGTDADLKEAQSAAFADFDTNYWQVNQTTGCLEFISAVK